MEDGHWPTRGGIVESIPFLPPYNTKAVELFRDLEKSPAEVRDQWLSRGGNRHQLQHPNRENGDHNRGRFALRPWQIRAETVAKAFLCRPVTCVMAFTRQRPICPPGRLLHHDRVLALDGIVPSESQQLFPDRA